METNKSEITTRYKRSVLLDNVFAMLPLLLSIVIGIQVGESFFDSIAFVLFSGWIVAMIYILFSDIICFSRSFGKRIYHIKVFNNDSSNRKVSIATLVHRHILELTIHPLFTKSFHSKADMIDKLTQTHIEMIKKDI